MDDFMPDVDRRPKIGQSALDNFDRPFDARAEAARLGQNDVHRHLFPYAAP
jgi:hypothetical protein